MTAIRWIALLPDSFSGKDVPIVGDDKKPREWLAPDKETARAQIKASLTPAQFRLALIMSVLEYEASESDRRLKAAAEEKVKFYKHAHRTRKP